MPPAFCGQGCQPLPGALPRCAPHSALSSASSLSTAAVGDGPIEVYLAPGQTFVGGCRHRVRTLLGSCVSITLWHPRQRVGAMSHYLLSQGDARQPAPSTDPRYAEGSLQQMLTGLAQFGVDARECVAKVFGGGNMFPDQHVPGAIEVGRRNGETAQAMLQSRGIALASSSLFGDGHRQVVFDIGNGDVWCRQMRLASEATA